MATYTVTTLADERDPAASIETPGGTGLSLREAISLANANAGHDTIVFAPNLAGGTIRLTNAAGTLQVIDALTIDGDIDDDGTADILITGDVNNNDATVGASNITHISATAATELDDNVQILLSTADLTIDGLVLTGGHNQSQVGGAIETDFGTSASLTIRNSQISGNLAAASGGGVYAGGTIHVTNSTFDGNSADNAGGGIYAATGGSLDAVTVIGNTNGGIYSNGPLDITSSTISGNSGVAVVFNQAGSVTGSTVSDNTDGGIIAVGVLDVVNTTISGNSGDEGAGIYSYSTVNLTNVTVTGNRATNQAGGIFSSVLTLTNSIVTGNEAASNDDVAGIVSKIGGNIIGTEVFHGETYVGDTTVADIFAVVAANPSTGVVSGVPGDNGGVVQTIALLNSSINPALDASNNTAPLTDARGKARVDFSLSNANGNAADLGVYELTENTGPSVSKPDNQQTVAEDTPLVFDSGLGNAITIADPDTAILKLTLSALHGTLTLATLGDLVGATGNSTDTVTASGTMAGLNAALSGLVYKGSANYHGPDVLTVIVDDGLALPKTETIPINITPLNDAPTALDVSNLRTSIAENTSTTARIKIADLSIADVDGGPNASSLTGVDSSFFEILGNAVHLKAGVVLDFEAKASYAFAIDVDDPTINGNIIEVTRPFTLAVTEVNEAPTAVVLANAVTALAENTSTAARRKIADIVITDDALGTETITLTGTDASLFEIFGGDVYLKAGAKLDFETNAKLDVTINVDDRTLGSGIELSRALSVNVTDVIETLAGGTPNADRLNGTPGADRILGLGANDSINGGGGDDVITGGAGVDRLTGGTGRDTFTFTALTDSGYRASGSATEKGPLTDTVAIGQRDIISDFTPGTDKIDLSAIDANANVAGDQAFTFRGTGDFAGAGSFVYRAFDNAGTATDRTIIFADVTGDGRSDFQIELTGLKTLTAGDFVL